MHSVTFILFLAGLGQKSILLYMLLCPNEKGPKTIWFSKVENKHQALTVQIYILWQKIWRFLFFCIKDLDGLFSLESGIFLFLRYCSLHSTVKQASLVLLGSGKTEWLFLGCFSLVCCRFERLARLHSDDQAAAAHWTVAWLWLWIINFGYTKLGGFLHENKKINFRKVKSIFDKVKGSGKPEFSHFVTSAFPWTWSLAKTILILYSQYWYSTTEVMLTGQLLSSSWIPGQLSSEECR